MTNIEVPSDGTVVDALRRIGGHASAVDLCRKLVSDGHPRRQSQLAIQRAAERGCVVVEHDWTLSLIKEAIAA